MNVLWIMADQMRADCAGFMGHPIVRTPDLDALAARGAVFENTFAQSPICTPSRVCYFTSRYVHAHGAWWNGVPMSRERVLLPEILRQSGYRTGLVGKLHFFPQDRDYGFDHRELHEEHLPTELSAYSRFLSDQRPPARGPAACTEWSRHAAMVGTCQMDESIEETSWVADRTCALLREQTDQPFFLYASFIRPHSPYNPLPRFAKLYESVAIEAPPFSRGEYDRLPARIRVVADSQGWDKLTPEDFAEMRRNYYALCSQVDENVGRILSCLEEQGLTESTIVVFAADHGDFVGEHGCFGKSHLWDGSLHVPLVICDPRRGGGALRYRGLVETIDVMPTLLDLLGIAIPDTVQGESLTHVIDEPERSHRDAVFAGFASYSVHRGVHEVLEAGVDPKIVSVRTDRWKYIHYVDEAGELYDLQDDPAERSNLFDDINTQPIREALREQLLNWQVRSNDNRVPERGNSYFRSFFDAPKRRITEGRARPE